MAELHEEHFEVIDKNRAERQLIEMGLNSLAGHN